MSLASKGLSRLVRGTAWESEQPDTPPALEGAALAAVVRIVELQQRQVPIDTLTAEVLPAMLGLFDAPAGALLLYRREDATLTLASARGLAVAGAEALDVVHWGAEQGFEMPLRALVDRKVYVIDRPAEDSFARRLTSLDERRALSSVAAVPLYRWQLPVGVLLVLAGETPIAAEALLQPRFAYDVLGLALSTLLWARDDRATPLPASDVAPPPLICVPWIDTRRASDGEGEALSAEREAAVAAARAESRSAVETGMAAAREESRAALDAMLHELRAAVAGLEAERQATAEERSVLRDQLAGAEQERALLAERLAAVESDRHAVTSRLEGLERDLVQRVEAALTSVAVAPPPVSRAAESPTATIPTSPAAAGRTTAAPPRRPPRPRRRLHRDPRRLRPRPPSSDACSRGTRRSAITSKPPSRRRFHRAGAASRW